MAAKKMKVIGLVTLTEKQGNEFVQVLPGEKAVSLAVEEAEDLIERGMAIKDDGTAGAKPAKVVEDPKPTTSDIAEALANEILPNLSDEEWGNDKVPNLDVLVGKLSAHFNAYVPVTAEQRDAIVTTYKDNADGGNGD